MRTRWTQGQIAQIMDMRFRQRMKLRVIGEHFGRNAEQIGHLIRRVIDSETDRKNPVAREIARSLGGSHRPPVEVLLDRDKRVNAPRTLSMKYFGDPVTIRWNSNAAP